MLEQQVGYVICVNWSTTGGEMAFITRIPKPAFMGYVRRDLFSQSMINILEKNIIIEG